MTPYGAFVSIREAPPTENNACLSLARFDQDLSYCSDALVEKDIKFKAVKTGIVEVLITELELFINFDPVFCTITSC